MTEISLNKQFEELVRRQCRNNKTLTSQQKGKISVKIITLLRKRMQVKPDTTTQINQEIICRIYPITGWLKKISTTEISYLTYMFY